MSGSKIRSGRKNPSGRKIRKRYQNSNNPIEYITNKLGLEKELADRINWSVLLLTAFLVIGFLIGGR